MITILVSAVQILIKGLILSNGPTSIKTIDQDYINLLLEPPHITHYLDCKEFAAVFKDGFVYDDLYLNVF